VARVAHELEQQAVFGCGERDGLAVLQDLVRVEVDRQIPDRERGHGSDWGRQLGSA